MPNSYDDIAKKFSVPAGKRGQKGRIPKELPDSNMGREVNKRPYHTFSKNRERQLLRHIATQLFHAVKTKGIAETEIQVMHFGGSLFVSSNKLATGKEILKLVNEKTLKTVLTATYKLRLNEDKVRSLRYANKLKKRVFGKKIAIPKINGDIEDSLHAESVAAILQNGNCRSLDLIDPDAIAKALSTRNNIYIITGRPGGKGPNPHAEEFLVDIRDAMPSNDERSAIAGKKRPCMGCSGRMHERISNYNTFPGYFWLDTIKHKDKIVAKKIVDILKEQYTHVSTCKNGKTTTEYDSGSDSECENLEIAVIPNIKI